MTDNPTPTAEELSAQVQLLSRLLISAITRLEGAEEAAALTVFIQDELCQHVERLLTVTTRANSASRLGRPSWLLTCSPIPRCTKNTDRPNSFIQSNFF
ncbi:MAG TPA: hypothetical protein VHX38_25845 [Pseudonocardiaceae bacterium]|jgi:hypothetical protein|nr:hypothetical protein [Pseudonocardiaceae bacterium]